MKSPRTATAVLIGIAALLLVSIAVAFAGEHRTIEVRATDKTVLILDGGEPTHITLDDLADGASRTFDGPSGPVTVTRNGEKLEITSERDGGKRQLHVTRSGGPESFAFLAHREGAVEKKVEVSVENGTMHLVLTEDGNETILEGAEAEARLKELEAAAGDGRHVFVRRLGHSDGAHAMAFAHGHGAIALGSGVVLRCEKDDVVVSGPAAALDGRIVTCPVCGTAMAAVEGKARVVHFKVVGKDESSSK